ncbi:Cuticle Protein CPAP1 [Hyalella azteca]|uniref:Cuticle Protein CPAP1 n=1 Tax=Hyalella azteca TaxID=294128 RepID=A0A6A0H8X1_HYAAZ|nr:Cuticle Protein CPAP1 [Hyalella azteca]
MVGVCLAVLILAILAPAEAQKKKNKNKAEAVDAPAANITETLEDDKPTGPPLTGDPQKDYIYDPNLPHELIGYDLSNYPFYKRVPKEGHNFTCDDRHDGFYASVPHKCQVYYNCLFSQRYDFLCPNYTVFDQVNFICHYASEVDCNNSERYYARNEELYVTTTTTTQAPKIVYLDRPRPRPLRPLNRQPNLPKRRRPQIRVGPKNNAGAKDPAPVETADTVDTANDYYDTADYYADENYDDYYYDDAAQTTTTSTTTTVRPLKRRNRPGSGPRRGGTGGRRRQRPRQDGVNGGGGRRRRIRTSTTTAAPVSYDYYDDYYYDDYEADQGQKIKNEPAIPTTTTTAEPRVKPGQRRRPSFQRAQNIPGEEPENTEALPLIDPLETTREEAPVAPKPAEAESPATLEETPTTSGQIRSQNKPTAQRIRTRPVNSRGFAVVDGGANAETIVDEAIVTEPKEPAQESLQDRRQRLGLSRRGPPASTIQADAASTPVDDSVALEEEEPVPQAGRGFGGRRSRS